MGIGFRVAPGLRISASSRGVRLGVGPRIARVHVGAGRVGVSSGTGPFTAYTSLGSGRRPNRRRTPATSRPQGPTASQLAAHQRAQDSAAAAAELAEILAIHREDFTPARSPQQWPTPHLDPAAVLDFHLARCGRGANRRDAAQASVRAQALAAAEIAALDPALAFGHDLLVRQAQPVWDRLVANEPDLVLAMLGEAFADNVATAVPVDVDGDAVSVVVLFPDESTLPERLPSVTSAGAPTTRKATVAQRAELYRDLAFGHLVVTVKEAFAVAPGIGVVRVIGLRDGGLDAYGQHRTDCLVAVSFRRDRFVGIDWARASAAEVVRDAGHDLLVKEKGAAKALQPLDPGTDPALAAAANAVTFE